MANKNNIILEDNQIEGIIIPQTMQEQEIILDDVSNGRPVHIPIADYEHVGIASFDKNSFIIDPNGHVKFNPAAEGSISSKLTRVEDVTERTQVYAKLADGEQAMLDVSPDIEADLIVQRDDVGGILIPAPSLNNHATNKKYVDDNIFRSVSGVFPDENRDVPLIVFQLPENPQEGQIWFDTLDDEVPAQTMGYTVAEEEAPVVEETSGYTVTEEPETQLIVENTFANEVYNEYVFTNNEIIENSYKE